MSLMKKPDGKGKSLVMKFEDYMKYGWDEAKGWWEDSPLLIFPFCKRPEDESPIKPEE